MFMRLLVWIYDGYTFLCDYEVQAGPGVLTAEHRAYIMAGDDTFIVEMAA